MNQSKNHNNWVTVGEVINLIEKPVSSYTSHTVKKWHAKLCQHCLKFGRCINPGDCQTKKKPRDLCYSCFGWYDELALSHRNCNKSQIKWRQNCDTSKWPVDLWEIAKFFMSVLGDNKSTVKDAESTDLSSLLNVLEWMEDVAFGGVRRVNLDLVKKLRSEVRNTWAHAPKQEMTDVELNNAFDIANKFLVDLDVVFSCTEVKKYAKDIQILQANGITNVVEAELKALTLLRKELCGDVSNMKEKVKNLKEDQNSDRQIIKENEMKLTHLENVTKKCFVRMKGFHQETRKAFSEVHADIKELQDTVNVQETDRRYQLKTCIPEKLSTFTGRGQEVKQIISFVEKDRGIVSLVGGPGFGKSTIVVEVSHRLSSECDIVVIFSYLSNASTVPNVIQRLCLDVGVNPGEDPESSLMYWLRNIDRKVILVMDNIEQLLEGETRSQFSDLMRMLRKNSDQRLQILTTTRTKFSIPDLATENVEIDELDAKSSVELLRKCCPNKEVKDEYLSQLANLCGHVPLALRIVAFLIQDLDDPDELITWLTEKPMEVLQTSEGSQHVQNAIEISFQNLNPEDKKAFVRLSVFDGNFQRNAAQEVIKKNGIQTQSFLKTLLDRSLIQRSGVGRFLIHPLIRRFLADYDRLQNERAIAQGLMVNHFLKVCQSLTVAYYSKGGFNDARESFKNDAHNVEKMLKFCSQDQETNLKPNVVESLTSSDIYQSSSRFFYNFIRNLLPQTVVRIFLKSCVQLAESRNQPAAEINFRCLLADQEGRKSAWKSDKYIKRMKDVKKAFDRNKALLLKEDSSLLSHYYYLYGRYLAYTTANASCPDLEEAEDYLASCWSLPAEKKGQNSLEKADEAIMLIQLGRLKMKRATKLYRTDKEKCEEYMSCSENYYNRGLLLAEELLGDHEITSTCYKVLGDLFLTWRKNAEALTNYAHAKEMHKNLQLYSSESVVYMLKNYGLCFSHLKRFDESVKQLSEACDLADKLAEPHTPCRAQVYCSLAKVFHSWRPDCQEAAKYATVAIEMKQFLRENDIKKMEQVIKTAKENIQIKLDAKSSVDLLRKYCLNKEVKDGYLSELANLCGHIPLALSIAASLIQDLDPGELITWLTEKPMELSQTSVGNQHVQKVIEISFKRLSDEDKKTLVRLSVFDGDFQENAAQVVTEWDEMKTQDFLKNLVARSLIQRSNFERFLIHPLIRRFLADYDQPQDERATAQELMVRHFLRVCQLLTVAYFSKDGFNDAKELLKNDAHNVEKTLKVCSQNQETNLNPNIIESLASSDIYKSSSRFFYSFIWSLLPRSVMRNFLKSCIALARSRKQLAIEINFQCMLADQEGCKTAWKSSKYNKMMEGIKEAFDRNEAVLREDSSFLCDYYYFYGRYLSNKAVNPSCPDFEEEDRYLAHMTSWILREDKATSPLEKAGEVMILTELGRLNKKHAKRFVSGEEKYEKYMTCAEDYYNQALSSAKEFLGDHEVTSTCYKLLGDLFWVWRKNAQALRHFDHAKEMYKKLQLHSGESVVNLLQNYGMCFFLNDPKMFDESVKQLNEARDLADKLPAQYTPCRAKVYCSLAEVFSYWKPDCKEAAKYAAVALEMKKLLHNSGIGKMENVIKIAEKNMALDVA